MTKLHDKLASIQRELKAPKGQFNSFGKYKYRSCEDILEAVKPLLNGTPLIISDEIVLIGDRYYVKATVYFGLDGPTVSAYAREGLDKKGMDDAQITGAASSYARKYALNGLFLIDDTKDADATNTHGKEPVVLHVTKPPEPDVPEKVAEEMLTSNHPLYKDIYGLISLEGLDSELFIAWLISKDKMPLPDFQTMTVKNAQYLVDNFSRAVKSYKKEIK